MNVTYNAFHAQYMQGNRKFSFAVIKITPKSPLWPKTFVFFTV